jgi:hypothetical protein
MDKVEQKDIDEFNEHRNCEAVSTEKLEMENYLHPAAIKAVRSEVDITFGDFDDVPLLVAQAVNQAKSHSEPWEKLTSNKRDKEIKKAKRWLNEKAAAQMTPELLDERDPNGEVRGWLSRIARYLEE